MSYDEAVRRINRALKQNEFRLDLSELSLKALPEEIGNLSFLRELDLSGNQLKDLPENFCQMVELTDLFVSNNQIEKIPEVISQLKNLQALSVSANNLTYIPGWLSHLTMLIELNFSENQLTSIPENIGHLALLRHFNLSENQLTDFPAKLGQLKELRTLCLCGNQLERLPESLGKLKKLQCLCLSDNQLASLPRSFGQLKALNVLDLSYNELMEIPESLGRLTELHSLGVHGNQLTKIPDSLGNLTRLRTLDLSENQLTEIPKSLNQLLDLKGLFLHENNLLGIPLEILGADRLAVEEGEESTDPQDILYYYFNLLQGKKPLNEAKLIIVGRGGVGKTSLVNRLVENRFESDEQKTEGIKITGWDVPIPRKDRTVRLNVWDFGGQEIMHATHQFFLTSRSLYLLVLSGREESEEWDADYWLRLIESFGDGSPVIVVLNKYKQHAFDVNRRALQEKFPFIQGFIETDCRNGFGMAKLNTLIKKETDRLNDVYAEFPKSWFELKEYLATMKENYLSLEQFQETCRRHGVAEENDQTMLTGYLHRLGTILNFPEAQLCDTHVLNPHWVTGGIYAVLNSKRLTENKGFFGLEDLGAMLPSNGYPKSKHVFLIELMKKFDLCFPLRDHGDRYLIPERLDEQEPEAAGEFKPEDCLNFQYHYPVLPKGLLPRFIVRTHGLSDDEPRWRTGVILKRDGCRALVKADIQDKKMFIRVSGAENRRRELLAVIRNEFDIIHGDIKGLKPDEMVPLPEHPQTVIPYKKLISFEEDGIDSFPEFVGQKNIKVDVKSLLDGVGRPKPSRRVVIDTLSDLMESQLELLKVQLPPEARKFLAGGTASPAEKAKSIIEWAETPGGCGLGVVAECIDAVTRDSSWRKSRHRGF